MKRLLPVVFFAWTELTEAQPVPLVPDFRVSSSEAGGEYSPSLSLDPAGSFVIVWNETFDQPAVFGRRFASDGSPVDGEFPVASILGGLFPSNDVVLGPDGRFVVAWPDGNKKYGGVSVFARRFGSNGAALDEPFTPNDFVGGSEKVSLVSDPNSAFTIVWSGTDPNDIEGIFGRRYDPEGVVLGAQFILNEGSLDQELDPSASARADGDFVVIWQQASDYYGNYRDIVGRRYASSGEAQGPEFSVSTDPYGRQYRSDVARADDGSFVVVWVDYSISEPMNIFGRRYASDGTEHGDPFQVNTTIVERSENPAVAADADGDFAVVWESGDNGGESQLLRGQLFQSSGAPLGAEFQVSSFTTVRQSVPAIEMTADGHFVVAWSVFTKSDGYQIFARRFAPPGGEASPTPTSTATETETATQTATEPATATATATPTWTASFTATTTATPTATSTATASSTASASQTSTASPNSTSTATETVTATASWTETATTTPTATNTSTSTASWTETATATAEATVTATPTPTATETATSTSEPSATPTETARATASVTGTPTFTQTFTPTRTATATQTPTKTPAMTPIPIGPAFQVRSGGQTFGSGPAVAADSQGRFVVVWNVDQGDGGARFGRRFSASGVPLGAEFHIATSSYGTFPFNEVDFGSDEQFILAWVDFVKFRGQRGNEAGILARRFSFQGPALGPVFQVDSQVGGGEKVTVEADSSDRFVVVWPGTSQADDFGIFGQRYNSAGNRLGAEFLLNQSTQGNQFDPDMGMQGSGDFVVVWRNDNDSNGALQTSVRRYSSSGASQGSEFLIGTDDHAQFRPAVAQAASGNFVVVWEDLIGRDGDGVGVFGQRYASGGAPLGDEFQINATTIQDQAGPVIGTDSDGDFVVIWVNRDPQEFNGSVMGRFFHSSGQPFGGEFQVNPSTSASQNYPAVDMEPRGNFVVVWHQQSGSGEGGLMARVFAPPGSTLTPTFTPTVTHTPTVTRTRTPTASPSGTATRTPPQLAAFGPGSSWTGGAVLLTLLILLGGGQSIRAATVRTGREQHSRSTRNGR